MNLKKSHKRFSAVLLFSVTGIILSLIFLKPKEINFSSDRKQNQIATILNVKNEVQRQLPNHISWEMAGPNDILQKGEKLKTNSNSSALVQFLSSKTTLNIDPNSTVIIDQNEDQLALRVLSGNLFIKQGSNKEKISLFSGKDGDKKIELTNAEAAIGVTSNGKASVDVVKGNVTQNGTALKSSSEIWSELQPYYGEAQYIDDTGNFPLKISWKPISKKYAITIYLGETREKLEEIMPLRLNPEDGNAKLPPVIGTYYWKLMATDVKTKEKFSSSIQKLNSEKIAPPILIFPSNAETLRFITNQTESFEFKWNLLLPLQNIKIEFSSDLDFKQKIITDSVTKQTYYETSSLQSEGKYYWHVYGNIPNSSEIIVSKTFSFNIIKGRELVSPNLLTPDDNFLQLVDQKSSDANLVFTWNSELDAKNYLLTIKSNSSKKEIIVPGTTYIFKRPSIGSYTWSVQSIGEDGKKSKTRESRFLKVLPLSSIDFLSKPLKEISYVEKIPPLQFKWNSVKDASKYILFVSQSEQFLTKEKHETELTEIQFDSTAQGKYFFYVEALNQELNTIAKSPIISANIFEKPLPAPPFFYKDLTNPITANLDGDVVIRFDQPLKNNRIIVELRNSNELLIEKTTLDNNLAKFSALHPGKYIVTARMIDEYSRMSDYGEKRTIVVVDKSKIAVPKLKGIKIK